MAQRWELLLIAVALVPVLVIVARRNAARQREKVALLTRLQGHHVTVGASVSTSQGGIVIHELSGEVIAVKGRFHPRVKLKRVSLEPAAPATRQRWSDVRLHDIVWVQSPTGKRHKF